MVRISDQSPGKLTIIEVSTFRIMSNAICKKYTSSIYGNHEYSWFYLVTMQAIEYFIAKENDAKNVGYFK